MVLSIIPPRDYPNYVDQLALTILICPAIISGQLTARDTCMEGI